MMRLGLMRVIAMALVLPAGALLAQDAAPDQTSAPPAQSQTPTDQTQTCVDVQIGGDRSAYLNCLNNQMKQGVEREHQVPQPTAPIDAQSPSNQVGTANDAAAREKMGNAFGKSATPQRPPVPVFTNPLVPGSH